MAVTAVSSSPRCSNARSEMRLPESGFLTAALQSAVASLTPALTYKITKHALGAVHAAWPAARLPEAERGQS